MEYPTLVTVGLIAPGALGELLDPSFAENVTTHEVAHQWWQSTAATNEFEEPWLDEGLAQYSGVRLMDQVYGDSFSRGLISFAPSQLEQTQLQYLIDPSVPMYGQAWDFESLDYAIGTYYKPTVVFTTMERLLGEERWLSVLATYYQRHRFQHPTTEDFLQVVAEVAGPEWRAYIEPLVFDDGIVDYGVEAITCTGEGNSERCQITVARLGEVALPVEIEVTLADGRQIRELWDGREQRVEYLYSHLLRSVQVDPEGKIVLDTNPLNNSLARQVQVEPLLRIGSGWLYALEQFILIVGGLW